MSDVLSAQHPPALRVGGRRLSISARPRPHNATSEMILLHGSTTTPPGAAHATENADYPRPTTTTAAQGDGEEQARAQQHDNNEEEEAPKKEKKHGHGGGGHDRTKLKESVYHKLDATMPSKDHAGMKHAFGAGGRIGQPMGKALAV